MEAALANAGEVAAAFPLHVEEVDADAARSVPLCVAKVKTPALLKLKMLLDGQHEVFQQWEHPEEADDDEDEEARGTPVTSCLRVPYCTTAEIEGYCPESARPVFYHFFHHDLSAFDLDEESTIPPSRHTAAPAANLNWSANILSIKVLSSTMGYPVNLYGSVYVRDDLDHKRVYLFCRDRDNAQLVKSPEETLALTGPSRGLVVFDNLFFDIDLKMRCDQEVAGMNFSQGIMQYSNASNSSWLLAYRSHLLTDQLVTEMSTVELMYAPVRRAVEASIQIKVRECSAHGDGVLSLYGKVSAFITDTSEEIILYDSEASGNVLNIRNDGLFELCRSVISVPIDGSLTLIVETWEGDSKANLSTCSTIFTPQICDENVARCAFHPFWIKVAWSPLYIPKFDDHKIAY
ncbi:hypothetical protein U9M48_018739 [Paspalum notatum var. saurae]|uniref:DUF6598 domain-containing protein n=1 Tax=Paspalum notatum var. saurae TaxID=547442 RepID=A0AAQ3TB92_PASNO